MKKLPLALLLMIVSSVAFADPAGAAKAPGMMSNIIMLVGFLLIFYFMLIRPQMKRAKEQQSLISALAKDDEVIINGGILGKIIKVSDQFVVVSIATETEIKVQKQAISAALPKGTLQSI